MYINCTNCGASCVKEVKRINYAKKHNKNLFCSRQCASEYKVSSILSYCNNCNKEIKVLKSRKDKSKSNLFYCCKSCAISKNNQLRQGENHPNYQNGRAIYRKIALDYYGTKCEICKYSIEECLEIHHIDRDRNNNSLENLVVLCPTHHTEVHKGILKVWRQSQGGTPTLEVGY